MLGSKKGLRDISRGVNDTRSGMRQMKIAFAPPERKAQLLTEERDMRLSEAEKARSKAVGWGAKKFIQVAERAEHEARKAQKELDKVWTENPELRPEPVVTSTPSSPAARLQELDRLRDQGLISQAEFDQKRQSILEGL